MNVVPDRPGQAGREPGKQETQAVGKNAVWLQIRSNALTLEQLDARLGVENTDSPSHDLRSPHGKHRVWEEAHWRYEPQYNETDDPPALLDALIKSLPPTTWEAVARLTDVVGKEVVFGIFLEPTFLYSVFLRADQLAFLASHGLDMEAAVYPAG